MIGQISRHLKLLANIHDFKDNKGLFVVSLGSELSSFALNCRCLDLWS